MSANLHRRDFCSARLVKILIIGCHAPTMNLANIARVICQRWTARIIIGCNPSTTPNGRNGCGVSRPVNRQMGDLRRDNCMSVHERSLPPMVRSLTPQSFLTLPEIPDSCKKCNGQCRPRRQLIAEMTAQAGSPEIPDNLKSQIETSNVRL